MKLYSLVLLGGTLALAGCGGSSASPKTTDPTAVLATGAGTSTPATIPTSASIVSPHLTPYQQGVAYIRTKQYKQAESAFRQAVTAHQNTADAYAGLGLAALALGDYMSALRAYKDAATLNRVRTDYVYQAALSALYAKDGKTAESLVTQYLRARPTDYKGYHLRFLAEGLLADRKGQFRDARAELALQSRNPDSYNDLGIALGNNGKYKLSEQAISRAIKLAPNNPNYYRNRAFVENLDHKFSLALADMERAHALYKDPVDRNQSALAIKNLKKYMATH